MGVALDRTLHMDFFLPNIFLNQEKTDLSGVVGVGRGRWGGKGQDFLKTFANQLQELIFVSSDVSFTKN